MDIEVSPDRSMIVRHRRGILVIAAAVVALAAVVGGNVAHSLSVGGFVANSSEYERGRKIVTDQMHGGTPTYVLLVSVRGAKPYKLAVTDPAVIAEGRALTAELRSQPGVLSADSYWTLGDPQELLSRDQTEALVFGVLSGDEDAVRHSADRLTRLFTRDTNLLTVRAGGPAEIYRQVGVQAERDLRKAELLAAPFTFVALLLVFGGLAAALLPLAIALVAVVVTFAVLRVLTLFTAVSIFSLNLTTALGLGLAIDYSLFFLTRYREERSRGHDLDLALRRTMQTAGRTIIFSAATVAVSLAALLIFPMSYLRSYAYGGMTVVAAASVGAVLVLPALIVALGDRVKVSRRRPTEGEGLWGRQARRVMRRPVWVSLAVTAVLLAMGGPFLHLRFGFIDDRVVPPQFSSRAVMDAIRYNFDSPEADAIAVMVNGLPGDKRSAEVDRIAKKVASLDGVVRVDSSTGHYLGPVYHLGPDLQTQKFLTKPSTWLSIVPSKGAISPETERLVRTIRAMDLGHPFLVTGPTARFVDSKDAVNARLPLALAAIALVTFLVLFALLGSVVVPAKAVVVNVLSLGATFGAMVWVFQDGHLASLLDVTAPGFIDVFTPILMFCVAFGLSMDYEVFLLCRIKEEYDLSGDNTHAIAVGLDRTGRLVTSAAGLLAIVFASFMTSDVSVVKLVGLGLTLAVLIDAFIIRATLVPAIMKLAGRTNWWAPRPLRRFHLRFGIWEREPSLEMDRLWQSMKRR